MPIDLEKVPNAETRAAMVESRLIIAERRSRFESGEDLLASLQAERRSPESQDGDRG